MFCEKCGNHLNDNAKFCEKCGAEIKRIVMPQGDNVIPLSKNVNIRSTEYHQNEQILYSAEKAIGHVIFTVVWEIMVVVIYFMLIEPLILKPIITNMLNVDIRYDSIGGYAESEIVQGIYDIGKHGIIVVLRVLTLIEAFIGILIPCIHHPRGYLYFTNKKIVGDTGDLLGNHTLSIEFNEILQIEANQGNIGKLFQYGYLKIKTYAGAYRFILKDPISFKYCVEEQINRTNKN